MDATVETGTGAAVTINAVPTLAVEAEVSVRPRLLDAVASASANTGGTCNWYLSIPTARLD